MPRINFLGLRLDPLTMADSLMVCEQLIKKRDQQHVVLNASKTVLAARSPKLASTINNCALVNADGQSVVTAARFLGHHVPERVAGIDLMRRLLDLAPERGWRVYLLGAHGPTLEKVAEILHSEGVNVVGKHDGYWLPGEEESVVANIAHTASDLLFVALPSPRKEHFLDANLAQLNTGLAFGVGGSFDVIAGKTRRAPVWMQSSGIEWVYRLVQEPRRMFKRYLVGNFRFIQMVLMAKIRGRG